MAATHTSHVFAIALVSALLLSLAHGSLGARRKLMELYTPQPSELLTYHNGTVLRGGIPVSVLWYGHFTPSQKAVVSDFLLSLTAGSTTPSPSVSQWWDTINQLYLSKAKGGAKSRTQVTLVGQVSNERCSLGKSLKLPQLAALAANAKPSKGGIALVLTAQDVAVEGFCMSRCGLHGSDASARTAYVWVGNSAAQCPGQCAWPFHKPAYGPQAPALVPPSGDVGMDGMVMNVASMVAGAVTNPFGDGFYQGPKGAATGGALGRARSGARPTLARDKKRYTPTLCMYRSSGLGKGAGYLLLGLVTLVWAGRSLDSLRLRSQIEPHVCTSSTRIVLFRLIDRGHSRTGTAALRRGRIARAGAQPRRNCCWRSGSSVISPGQREPSREGTAAGLGSRLGRSDG